MMHTRWLPATIALVVAACDRRAAQSVDTVPVVRPVAVAFQGFGAARFGMTRAEFSAAGGGEIAAPPRSEPCRIVSPASFPPGVRLMLVNDTIVRVDVDSGGVPTIDGVRVGDPESKVAATYPGRVLTQPHKYVPGWHYLIVSDSPDSTRRLVFETDGSKVTTYRAGLRPAVDFIEGCG